MAFHSRLISGNQEWVISIIGHLEQNHQHALNQLCQDFHTPLHCCTLDFSRANELSNESLHMLLGLPYCVDKIQIIGCNRSLLNRLKRYQIHYPNIDFL